MRKFFFAAAIGLITLALSPVSFAQTTDPNIAAKHEHEVAVNLIDGQKSAGDAHAPLIYALDPRTDVPAQLQRRLEQEIGGSDDRIVSGWLRITDP